MLRRGDLSISLESIPPPAWKSAKGFFRVCPLQEKWSYGDPIPIKPKKPKTLEIITPPISTSSLAVPRRGVGQGLDGRVGVGGGIGWM